MIDKKCAEDIQQLSLKAITILSELLNTSQDRCSEEVYERLKGGVGLSIGAIQMNILEIITSYYPELDDLK